MIGLSWASPVKGHPPVKGVVVRASKLSLLSPGGPLGTTSDGPSDRSTFQGRVPSNMELRESFASRILRKIRESLNVLSGRYYVM